MKLIMKMTNSDLETVLLKTIIVTGRSKSVVSLCIGKSNLLDPELKRAGVTTFR